MGRERSVKAKSEKVGMLSLDEASLLESHTEFSRANGFRFFSAVLWRGFLRRFFGAV